MPLYLEVLEMPGPDLVDPVDLPHDSGALHLGIQLGVGELQADDVQDARAVIALKIPAEKHMKYALTIKVL